MKKIATVVWIALLWTLCALPVYALAAEPVQYVERTYASESNQVLQSTKTVSDYTVIDSNTIHWSGWMVAQGDVTIDARVNTQDDTYLILTDGAKLTVNGGIEVWERQSLTIYGQSADSGLLVADASNVDNAAGIGTSTFVPGSIVIHGGTIQATGCTVHGSWGAGIGGNKGMPSHVVIYGGRIRAENTGETAAIGGALTEGTVTTVAIHGGVIDTVLLENSAACAIGGNATVTITGGLFHFGGFYWANTSIREGTAAITGGAFNFVPDGEQLYILTRDAHGGSLTATYLGEKVGRGTEYHFIAPGMRLNVLPTSYDSQKPLAGLYLLEEGDPLPVENFTIDSAFSPVLSGVAGYDFTMPDSNAVIYAVFDPQKVSIPKTYTLQQGEAANAETILWFIQNDLAERGVELEATAIQNLTIIPAAAGDKNNPTGADGSFSCTVVLSNGTHEGEAQVTGTILARPYVDMEKVRVWTKPFGKESIVGDLQRYGFTLDDIAVQLQEMMQNKGIPQQNTQLWDVYAESTQDGVEWSRLSSAHVPEQGVTVTHALPDGISTSTHNIYAAHMFGETFGGHYAGEVEWLNVNAAGENAVSYVMRSFSPVMIGWVEKEPLPPPAQPPQTGDDSQLGLWLALCLISLAGMRVVVLSKR